jgi:hypothetical protein
MVDRPVKPKPIEPASGDPNPTGSNDAGVTTSGTTTSGAQTPSTMTAQEAAAAFASLRDSFKFSQIVDLVKAQSALLPEQALKLDTWTKLAQLETTMNGAVNQANNPSIAIDVPSFTIGAGPVPAKVFLQNGTLVAQNQRDGIPPVPTPLSPQNYIEIAAGVAARSTDSSEMAEWLELFSKEFGVSVPTTGP